VRKKLGECLIQAGLISEDELQTALAEQRRTGDRLGAVLDRLNFATEKQITKALAYQFGLPYVSLTEEPPERSAIVLIPKEVALARACVAIRLERHLLTVAMSDPLLSSLVQDLELQTGHTIKQVVATKSDILDSIASGYSDKVATHGGGRRDAGTGVHAPVMSDEASQLQETPPEILVSAPTPAIAERPDIIVEDRSSNETATIDDLVALVVGNATASRASDIHIEPTEKGGLVRHRLDGLLNEAMNLPKPVHERLVARVKVLSGMNAAETQLPQDGRLRVKTKDGKAVDFRISTLPSFSGEKVVLRALDQRKEALPLEELGLSAAAMEGVRECLRHQHGMILVAGPTGSGKTTTLGSAITAIKSSRTNIVTIEDPIEYQIPGITQTQLNDEASLTFARLLRAVLRQDPDVVVVDDLRDRETAKIATQAAQRGQLVLSALHTHYAPCAVTRLADMRIEPYVIASALVGIVAQRLVRRLCIACRRQLTPDAETLRALSIPEGSATEIAFYHAVGCDECHQTGYRGRIGLFEVMPVTDKVRRLISQKSGEDLIRDAAIEAGMVSLGEDGLGKVKAGITTADELLRVGTEGRELRTLCPHCGGAVATDFKACPQCGHRLSGGCPKCARALQPDWAFCPYCATSTVSRKKKKLKERKRLGLPPSRVAEFKNQNR
jgi:type IV pilus assembly protein PilB